MRALSPLLLLLACRQGPVDSDPSKADGGASTAGTGVGADGGSPADGGSTSTSDEDEEQGSPYILDQEEDEQALHDLATIEVSVGEVFATLATVDPRTLNRAYETLRKGQGSSSCPYYYTDSSGETYYGYYYWFGGCTASSGAAFSGYGYSFSYDLLDYGSYFYEDYAYTQLFGSITDRLGQKLEMSGYAYHYNYGYPGYADRYGYAYIQGDARWDAAEAQGTWLAEELSVDVSWSWSYAGGYDRGTALGLNGAISGLRGEMNTALFESVYIYSADRGSPCEQEPSGVVSVRDAAGEWYEIEFQGPAWAGAPIFQPHCDGCGTVSWRGQVLGQVCPDVSPLLDWESRPWD